MTARMKDPGFFVHFEQNFVILERDMIIMLDVLCF